MQIPNNALPGLPSPFSQFTGKQFISEIDAIEAHPCVKTLLVICPPARLRGVTIDCVYSGDRLLDSDRPHHRPQHYDNMSADTQNTNWDITFCAINNQYQTLLSKCPNKHWRRNTMAFLDDVLCQDSGWYTCCHPGALPLHTD